MRKCKGKYYKSINGKIEPVTFELGYFHSWGSDYDEFENGVGNYSVAIVELPDGSVVTPMVRDIQFLDSNEL